MKLAFSSDIHLNFLANDNEIIDLGNKINATQSDIAVIAGDISEGPQLFQELGLLKEIVKMPIFYVCGNHDFYHSSFGEMNKRCTYYNLQWDNCKWLPGCGVVRLTDTSCLIGEDNWYDARYGNPIINNSFEMPDFGLIKELKKFTSRTPMIKYFNQLGDEAAARLKVLLEQAVYEYDTIYCLMHMPPFAEASVYGSNPSPDYSIPFFANKAMGEMLLDIKEANPTKTFVVLAGHSHYPAELHIDKLHVYVAGAKYRYPEVYTTIEVK